MTEQEWLSLDEGEEVVWAGEPRIWRIVDTVARAVAVTVVAAAAALYVSLEVDPAVWGLPQYTTTLVWGVAVVVALLQIKSVTVAYLRVDKTDYVLTNRRVYRRTGIFSETVTNVGVDRVQNTTLRKDLTGNLFDYGTVSVSTAGSGGSDLVVTDLDDPETFRDRLQEQVRAATESESGSRPAPVAGGLDDQTVDALLSEARQLRAVAERMEDNA
jgi:uncharacterized membrane protein YdbT with pleckstrin-like domain